MRYLWLALALAAAAPAAFAEDAGLPISKVTVFSSGVAYFEHDGRVNGNAEVLLRFKTEGINDLLKSLVVMDLGGGSVNSVNYASREPLARALKSFGVDLSNAPTLGQILRQLRGAEVVINAPEKITGKILGVQTRQRQILPSNTLITEEILDLVTPEGLKSVPLDTVRSISLVDEKLNSELNKALALLVENRDTDSKPVMLRFTGQGERPVRVGYIAQAPVWKSSYRLVLDEDKKTEPLLQGWAVVENTSDFDWEKVRLTLASGRPVSFIEDLYTPLYVNRPVVQPEGYASLVPQQYEEGLQQADRLTTETADQQRGALRKAAPGAAGGGFGGGMPGMPGAMAAPAPAASMRAVEEPMRPSVAAVATTAVAGEVFTYQIKEPVTLPRRQSAMLPIANQAIAARKVSIYNASVLPNHPLNGLWLTNSTGLTLLSGPVTVFDAGTYAGDALIGNLTPNEKRLLSYAIDLKVTVDSSVKQSQKVMGARIVKGVMNLTRKSFFTQTYTLKNKADQERAVVVEHPVNPDLKLTQPAEPAEKTPEVYRFEVPVPAGKTTNFEVREERTDTEVIAILPMDFGALQAYATNGELSQKVRDAFTEAARRKQALSVAEREVADRQQRITTLRREQADIRANMGALDRNSQGYQRFEKKLLDDETQIEALQKELEDRRAAAEKARADLEAYLNNLNVE